MLSLILGIFLVLCFAVYLKLKVRCTYWSKLGVKGPSGCPIVGNMFEFLITRKHYGQVYEDIYNSYPHASYVGFYRLLNEPAIIVRDLNLAKDVLVKSFANFHDNAVWVDKNRDPLSVTNPFIAKGELWKVMRSQIMPVFTPNKIKAALPYILKTCTKLEEYIANNLNQNCFDAKNLCSRFTLDNIASAAYGLEGQSLTNQNSDFMRLVENLFQPHKFSLIESIALLFVPSLGRLIKYEYIPKNIQDWLTSIISAVLDNCRKNHKIMCSSFLQSVISSAEKKGEKIDDLTLVGHCSTFLLEGFETSSSLMAFALYEFALNTDVQRKVHQEIDQLLLKYGTHMTYEAIQEMTYLEGALFETLRLHPAMYALQKQCTTSFELPPQFPNKKQKLITVQPGVTFVLPVIAIHNDRNIYENPHNFQPERFLYENHQKRHKCAYLAFGEGPRMCLGKHFGILQSKLGIATIMSKYTVLLSSKTKVPTEIAPSTFLLASKYGIYVDFKLR